MSHLFSQESSNVIPFHSPCSMSDMPECGFCETALWLCLNRQTMRNHVIHGPLAKILMDYPCDYTLVFLRDERESFKKSS